MALLRLPLIGSPPFCLHTPYHALPPVSLGVRHTNSQFTSILQQDAPVMRPVPAAACRCENVRCVQSRHKVSNADVNILPAPSKRHRHLAPVFTARGATAMPNQVLHGTIHSASLPFCHLRVASIPHTITVCVLNATTVVYFFITILRRPATQPTIRVKAHRRHRRLPRFPWPA